MKQKIITPAVGPKPHVLHTGGAFPHIRISMGSMGTTRAYLLLIPFRMTDGEMDPAQPFVFFLSDHPRLESLYTSECWNLDAVIELCAELGLIEQYGLEVA